jgi:hypothetical protein
LAASSLKRSSKARVPAIPSSTFAPHVLGLVELRLLFEEPDRRAGASIASPRTSVVAAGHDPQQRGLAGPVVAEDADLGAREERQRDVLEHLLVGRVHLRQAVHLETY